MTPMNPILQWLPLLGFALQIVLIPLILTALDNRIETKITRHNGEPSAHPALGDIVRLEGKIEALGSTIVDLRLAIERITPRRRASDYENETSAPR